MHCRSSGFTEKKIWLDFYRQATLASHSPKNKVQNLRPCLHMPTRYSAWLSRRDVDSGCWCSGSPETPICCTGNSCSADDCGSTLRATKFQVCRSKNSGTPFPHFLGLQIQHWLCLKNSWKQFYLQGHMDVRCARRLCNDFVVRGRLKWVNNNNNNNKKELGLASVDALDRRALKRKIVWNTC